MTAVAILNDNLDDAITITISEAAMRLRGSRAHVAELILDGRLTVDSDRRVLLAEVEQLGRRAPVEPERLPRVQDALLWLLHEWGGHANASDLALGLKAHRPSVSKFLQVLAARGYVERPGNQRDGWSLTDAAREYFTKVEKPM